MNFVLSHSKMKRVRRSIKRNKRSLVSTESVMALVNDFEHYGPLYRRHHSGTLKQHSVWVTFYIQEAMDTPNQSPIGSLWKTIQRIRKTNRLDHDFERLLIVSSLLHDIGKGGDLVFEYTNKPKHETKGYRYLDQQEVYLLKNHEALDVNEVLRSFSREEQEWIKWLVLYHWNLGKILEAQVQEAPRSVHAIAKTFIKSLRGIDTETPFGCIFVLMQLMLCCADVLGAQPYCGSVKEIRGYRQLAKNCWHTEQSAYKRYGYPSLVPKLIKALYDELGILKYERKSKARTSSRTKSPRW